MPEPRSYIAIPVRSATMTSARKSPILPWRSPLRRLGIEEVRPVGRVAAQCWRRAGFHADGDNGECHTDRDHRRARERANDSVSREDAQQDEREGVVIHDDRSGATEAAESCFATIAPGVVLFAFFPAQRGTDEDDVEEATQDCIADQRGSHGAGR